MPVLPAAIDRPATLLPDRTVTLPVPELSASDFAIAVDGRVRVIGVEAGQLVTRALEDEPGRSNGHAVADPERDLAKMAVIERHRGTGRIGLGFVRGFGLRAGALASSQAHDAHNLVVVGVDDDDMAAAANRLREIGGGQVAVVHGRVLAEVPCPIVVRLPSGGTAGAGPFHSQSMEALYAHYPGLVVMTPATVEDAYSMLLEAVAIDDPVIFCEHKYLYYHLKAESLPTEATPTGKARLARMGRDATIVTYSAMVHESLACAEELATEGWEIEVIDLRSIKPLDTDTVLASVARTGRLLAVGEAWPWGGVTAEILARVATEGFGLLDVPPMRLNAKDTPVPYHPNLWGTHRPTAKTIAAALRQLLAA